MKGKLKNKNRKLILYYNNGFIGMNDNIKSSRAYHNDYTIYYITNNALMIVE